MERNNRPAPPVSSERDDETRAALVLLLRQVGWDSAKDPDHARLTAALPSLRALLAPPALPAGGNAYPVETQQAHVMAVAATQGMPEGPEQQLAYTLAMARAMTGMTLHDWYAANAPTEPQQWFAPVMPHPCPEAPKLPADMTAEEREDHRAYMDDMINVGDVRSNRLAAHLRERESWRVWVRAWNADAEKQRWVQWPAAWADAQLAERERRSA